MRRLMIVIVLWTVALHVGVAQDRFWPRWRGPDDSGVAPGRPPVVWSDTEHVTWKTAIPGRGFSTPVAWAGRLFLTTAVPGTASSATAPTEQQLLVIALDRKTGAIAWQRTARTVRPSEGYHRTYGSYASSAPITDGKRLFAYFGSHGLFAYDLDGRFLWEKQFNIALNMRLGFGEGGGLTLHDDRLYLSFDHQEPGYAMALDAATGRELWRTPRNDGSGWSTPFVVTSTAGRQVVITAETTVKAYSAETGLLAWEAAGLSLNPIPQPLQHKDTVLVMSGYREPRLMAIRLGRTGDLTGTDAIVWQTTRGTAYTGTPALHDGYLHVVSDSGQMSVFDASTGTPAYVQQRLPNAYNIKASPVIAGGHVYIATEDEDVVVVRAGPRHELVAINTLADHSFIASPIIVGDELYLRSRTHVIRIARPGAPAR